MFRRDGEVFLLGTAIGGSLRRENESGGQTGPPRERGLMHETLHPIKPAGGPDLKFA
ncbi:hypothetical protein [Phenylobacterium sp.]|uniref:hypothetical protein n=1 Tax=Phenylobacterium sp. TaxID=1871053 RepID=UPI00301CA64B